MGLTGKNCKYFAVRNFYQFQHYKDRNPPWVKLHKAILEDEAFVNLPEFDRFVLWGCYLIAARFQNAAPNNPAFIQKFLKLSRTPDLLPLFKARFLIPVRAKDASKTLAKCYTDFVPRREEKKERREEGFSKKREEKRNPVDNSTRSISKHWAMCQGQLPSGNVCHVTVRRETPFLPGETCLCPKCQQAGYKPSGRLITSTVLKFGKGN